MTLLWLFLGVASAVVMMAASRVALRHAIAVSHRMGIPPFVVGFTLVAIGTDMPEIVNSVVSAYLEHGDVSLGDEVGSVFTQGTLVLGLFPFFMRRPSFARRDVVLVATLTIVALALGIALTRDDNLSRIDGAGMILVWVGASAIAWGYRTSTPESAERPKTSHSALRHATIAALALAIVGVSAAGLVAAVVKLSATLGVPEYVISFFGAALGTSMPELAVEITALRRGDLPALRRRQMPTLAELADEYLGQHNAEANTLRTLRSRLRYATEGPALDGAGGFRAALWPVSAHLGRPWESCPGRSGRATPP
jgi:cation:H+ antiporter